MYNALPMLTCEHDNYNNFYWILTIVKYVLRGVKISVRFVDERYSVKGVGMVGGEGKFPFTITQLLLKIEKKNPDSGVTVYLCSKTFVFKVFSEL